MGHLALLYFIKKPQIFGRITKWLFMFLKYNFSIIYKPNRSYSVVHIFSQSPDATKKTSIPYQIVDTTLFLTQPNWFWEIHYYLIIRNFFSALFLGWKVKISFTGPTLHHNKRAFVQTWTWPSHEKVFDCRSNSHCLTRNVLRCGWRTFFYKHHQ